jgi:hypothetical protein
VNPVESEVSLTKASAKLQPLKYQDYLLDLAYCILNPATVRPLSLSDVILSEAKNLSRAARNLLGFFVPTLSMNWKVVTLSAAKGLTRRFFASLRMTYVFMDRE